MKSARIEAARACRVWIEVKEKLRAEMNPHDFNHFVRPMYLLKLAGDCLIVSVPRNRRISERAKNCAVLQAAVKVRGYSGAFVVFYPSDEELIALSERFPECFAELPAPLRLRAEAAAERWAEEDARDAMKLTA